jgi:exo-1,4-beta-D-glucosaminidase
MKSLKSKIALFVLAGALYGCSADQTPDSYITQLSDGWSVESSSKVNAAGSEISRPGFDVASWYRTKVPATVMAALIANGEYPDVFMGDNINKVDTSRFGSSWWYRNEFNLERKSNTELIFEGINYRANVWLNGKQVASSDTLFGGFRIFKLNVTGFVKKGKNILAVEVFKPRPDEPSIGFVDWAPMSPDRLMGLWRPVKIKTSGKASLDNPFIISKVDKKSLKEAELQVSAEAVNNTSGNIEAVVKGKIENISFEKQVKLNPGERKLVTFTASEFPQLKISNPRIWWTWDLGKPELYELQMDIETGGKVAYSEKTRFGIREVEDYFNSEGHRGYKLNGVEVLIKGGGWVDGMFLNDTEEKVRAEFEYVKHANMNTIRLEGFWGNSERFYELADEMGLLIMAGWSCQWEWEGYLAKPEDEFMSIRTPEDIALILKYANDHVKWLRNHPSLYVWVLGSDKLPNPILEEKYYPLFKELDPSRPLLMSCKAKTSTISGKSGVKMYGPYDYVSPNYWYLDKENGGAYGFNTETGPGPQVPSLEVLKSMIPEDELWPVNDMWSFHCGRGAFKTLDRYIVAFNNRYGEQKNVEDFTFRSQASNLEAMRAMYEAFAVNRRITTGIVQWMYNSAWPKLIWQFWDYNLMPNAAFYGAKLGARNLNIIYNYGDKSVYLANLTPSEAKDMEAEITLYDLNGKVLGTKQFTSSVNSNASVKIWPVPSDPGSAKVYFLKLKLSDSQGNSVADNFYWLSTKPDVPDFKKTTWFYTPMAKYADFTDLEKLPVVNPEVETSFSLQNGKYEASVKLSNKSENISFLIELTVYGEKSGKSVVPVLWDDNYVSLVPGESRVIKATFPESALKDDKPALKLKGWNTGKAGN